MSVTTLALVILAGGAATAVASFAILLRGAGRSGPDSSSGLRLDR
jgi:hypothetical protein